MAALPQRQNSTVIKIYEHYEKQGNVFKPRPHLGASLIGKDCTRALWYDFRWATAKKFPGRMLRLFDTGNREEFRIVVDLRNAGVTVHDKDPNSGKQFQFFDLNGHFSGSMDGCVLGLIEAPKAWHVAEFKTHNVKSFAKLQKEGVEKAKPQHWHQMNTYMGWSGMGDAFYVAVCKDTDEIYTERIKFDKVAFERDRAKAKLVIEATEPLAKINNDPAWFECKFCDHHPICHVDRVPMVTCRTCVHSTPVVDDIATGGIWKCERKNRDLSYDEQVAACADHLFIPSLIPFAEVTEAGDTWIEYRNKRNGKTFANCQDDKSPAGMGFLTSRELHAMDPSAVGEPIVAAIKTEFHGSTAIPNQSEATA